MKKLMKLVGIALVSLAVASCNTSVDLSGKWEIAEVNGQTIEASEHTPFMEFDVDNSRVHGHTGVNIMNGSYTLDGNKLSLGKMATTMMAGPMEDMELERTILDTIEKSAKVKAADNTLQILDADGKVIMVLKK